MSSTAMASGQEPPSKKPAEATEPTTNLPLPDELVLECFARVSRLYYPILSFVSKGFRSHITSPPVHRTRYLLNRTEHCLYVCLQFPNEPNLRWFNLSRKTGSSSSNVLTPVQILNPPPPVEWSHLVAVGHKLYAMNKEDDDPSNVFFLDCTTHTWVETPSLRFAHTKRKFDGNMYLAGSYENPDSLNCVEVFNTETRTWKPVPEKKRVFKTTDFQGSVYKNFDGQSGKRVSVVVKLNDSTKDLVVGFGTTCLIDRILYRYGTNGELLWSIGGTELDTWMKVKGLEELPKFGRYKNVKLVETGGKMLVFWDKHVPAPGGYKEKMIWCAEISLEMRSSEEEVWGNVEWFHAVLTVPKSYKFVYAKAATV